ncbi:hypothetical protein [Pseudomonas poae]|uniref:hypothetical protein n=1 Tax=Pseudomonas poae TaxID=200451 RepID=UPI001145F41B|nr:hypothetical protein [Pseudomonas poae]
MKKFLSGRTESFSVLESEVDGALKHLPAYFSVEKPVNSLQHIKGRSGEIFNYKPDFEVTDKKGHKFLIEVKSENSMSLQNMVRFLEIDKMVRQEPNTGFLILVWARDTLRARYGSMDEFRQLNIYHVQNSSEIAPTIENAFSRYFTRR